MRPQGEVHGRARPAEARLEKGSWPFSAARRSVPRCSSLPGIMTTTCGESLQDTCAACTCTLSEELSLRVYMTVQDARMCCSAGTRCWTCYTPVSWAASHEVCRSLKLCRF